MSKAFTREGDGPELDERPPIEPWPVGVKNYLTPAGYAALKRAIAEAREAPRPTSEAREAPRPTSDARERARLEERLQALLQRLEAAEVIDPATQPRDVARFGATITVEDDAGRERRYRIVGVDEAEPRRGLVSWRSPIARALVGRKVGDSATVHTPAGDEELALTAIDYE